MGFVSDFIGDLTGANDAAAGASAAAGLQVAATKEGIAEQRRQFDKLVELLSPFVKAGTQSLGAQQALLGLGGADAQEAAIAGIQRSPQFASMVQQGEEALLQNASATGGLRGGNIQAALAQFRPQILSQLIESQFAKLGGITQAGQASAAGQAAAGLQTGSAISDLLQQQGAAQAGARLASANTGRQAFGDLLKVGGVIGGFF